MPFSSVNAILFGAALPALNLDFTNGVFRMGSTRVSSFTDLPGAAFARSSAGYAATSSGALVNFSSNVPRITDLGLLVEESRTNVALWSRDLTNAAWTKSNVTAALDQSGVDGAANSASSITATAGNGTALQAITLGSSARVQTAYVKRITGSGTVNMTMDNGSTWTAVTVTAAWTSVSIPTQTLANPMIGFRLVTSGDAIAVDFVQNEGGTFATSPILTTSASANRAEDIAQIAGLTLPPTGTVLAQETAYAPSTNTNRGYLFTLADTGVSRFSMRGADTANIAPNGAIGNGVANFGMSGQVLTTQTLAKIAMAYDTTSARAGWAANGLDSGEVAVQTVLATITNATAGIGNLVSGGRSMNGLIRSIAVRATYYSAAQRLAASQ